MTLVAVPWIHASALAQATRTERGTYESDAFAFAVNLPPRFEYDALQPGGTVAGFRALLPTEGSVWINGLHRDTISLGGAVAFVRAHRPRCREVSVTPATLGGLPATELVFMCQGGNASIRTSRLVVAVRHASGPGPGRIQYNLGLESPTPVDSATSAAFDIVRRGFRILPLK
jgi:hypothetical protein